MDGAIDELRLFTRGRESCIRSLLYRPFLYIAVHGSPSDDAQMMKVRTLTRKALEVCIINNSGHYITHRHHGTWYGLRESMSSGFMLIAAKLSGLVADSAVPTTGEIEDHVYCHALEACLEKLRYWEAESPADIRRGRELLEDLYAHT
jgi:hypothetical protein